ncbi:hypothetical protein [Marinibactrum halimedae]|uniref:Uncharacterized protein n=1 Tax=Marinibactrum halimedae TaxID=1444977 RepID=A0AA37T5C7_9GAMM|nr:hypothetical protein GCM10007877_28230 [Marinibactrum halimedae]
MSLSGWLCLSGVKALAQGNVVNIDETVTGNQEQPKVLYIVPWKSAANQENLEQDLQSQLLSGVFDHLERAELKREIILMQQNENQTE